MTPCPRFAERLLELARGTADDEAERHAASCAPCARLLADERGLSAALRGLAAADAAREAPPGLEETLRARLRTAPDRTPGRARRPGLALLAAAAVVLLAVALAVVRAPTPAPGVPPRAARAPRPEREFTPLVYGEPLDGAEALHLARVRVPRSALPSLGWGELEDGPPLEAEVLVGQDGLARGIRFVSDDGGIRR